MLDGWSVTVVELKVLASPVTHWSTDPERRDEDGSLEALVNEISAPAGVGSGQPMPEGKGLDYNLLGWSRGIRMDLCRSCPRFRTFDKILTCRPLEVCCSMMYSVLWLSEENAGRDHSGQKGEEGGLVGTHRGAHLSPV
jgi:hypothetical protein